jgi:hypothetical protein
MIETVSVCHHVSTIVTVSWRFVPANPSTLVLNTPCSVTRERQCWLLLQLNIGCLAVVGEHIVD